MDRLLFEAHIFVKIFLPHIPIQILDQGAGGKRGGFGPQNARSQSDNFETAIFSSFYLNLSAGGAIVIFTLFFLLAASLLRQIF